MADKTDTDPIDPQKTLHRSRPRPQAPTSPAPSSSAPTSSEWIDAHPGDEPAGAIGVGYLLSRRYRLERKLGEGGMGAVYFASDQEVLGETFAVKLMRPEIREYPESLALLREEVRKTRALQHPNIVGVYSLNSDRGDVYMLMEYLDGKTLSALIDEDFGRGMPLLRAWPLIQDICAALAYAHDHSVVHSDLKPANIFVTTAGKAKLLDFGIARAARGRASRVDPGAFGALTPAYASCEMIEGAMPDERDDIYALGCVIYEMLSGRHPFERRSAAEARSGGLRPAPLGALSREQNMGLAKALSFDRAARTGTVEELLAALDIKQTSGSRRGVWLTVTAVALLSMGAAGWFVWNSQRAPASAGVPPGSPAARARELAERARALAVVRSDHSLQSGMQLLSAGEQEMTNGSKPEGMRLLQQAAAALAAADQKSPRFARLGTSPDEAALAVNLCARAGSPCAAADFSEETPRMAILSPFELDQTAVSNRDFAAFAAATGYKTRPEVEHGLYAKDGSGAVFRPGETWMTLRDADAKPGTDIADYPVRGMDFESAKAFCASRGKRLPTEDEWEFVARGVDGRLFPWGNEPRIRGSGAGAGAGTGAESSLLPADQQPATGRFGNRGLGGGVWEWVVGGPDSEPVLRGASWLETNPLRQRLAARRLEDPAHAFIDTGFRCAKAVDAWPDAGDSGAG
jgi:formylglycine-generating enzyme required for sulfatase activity